jgi:hypothetical protein
VYRSYAVVNLQLFRPKLKVLTLYMSDDDLHVRWKLVGVTVLCETV